MKTIKICIGSACHLKGSYDVIEIFKELIHTKNLEEEIELSAAFCTGHCTEAVSIIRWDGKVLSANKQTAYEIFEEEIIKYLMEA